MTASFMAVNEDILSIKNASNDNDQHCPNHRSDESKVIPEIRKDITNSGIHAFYAPILSKFKEINKKNHKYQNLSLRSSLSSCSLITFLSSSVTASDVVEPRPLGDPVMLLDT